MALNIFLKIPGVEGESTDKAHPGEIVVTSYSWGATGATVQASGAGAGKVVFQAMQITKPVDAASPPLFLLFAQATRVKECILTVRRPGAHPLNFFTVSMKNVAITSIEESASASADQAQETLVLSFTAVMFNYLPQKPDGTTGSPTSSGFDLTTNTKA